MNENVKYLLIDNEEVVNFTKDEIMKCLLIVEDNKIVKYQSITLKYIFIMLLYF